jgi:hypothetical protein
MKISENLIKKLQDGGQMSAEPTPAPEPTAAPTAQGEGGQDPVAMIIETAIQAVQANDGQLALQVCAALINEAQKQMNGGQEPVPAEPVMAKRGGKLVVSKRL